MAILNKRLGKIVVGFIVLVTVVNVFTICKQRQRNHTVDHLNQLYLQNHLVKKLKPTEKKWIIYNHRGHQQRRHWRPGCSSIIKSINHNLKVEKYSLKIISKHNKDIKSILFSKSLVVHFKEVKKD